MEYIKKRLDAQPFFVCCGVVVDRVAEFVKLKSLTVCIFLHIYAILCIFIHKVKFCLYQNSQNLQIFLLIVSFANVFIVYIIMYIIVNTSGVCLEQNHKKNRHNRLSNFMHILTAENPPSTQKYPLLPKPNHFLTLPTSFPSKLSSFPLSPNTAFPSIPNPSQTLTSFPFHPSTLFYPLLHNLSTP